MRVRKVHQLTPLIAFGDANDRKATTYLLVGEKKKFKLHGSYMVGNHVLLFNFEYHFLSFIYSNETRAWTYRLLRRDEKQVELLPLHPNLVDYLDHCAEIEAGYVLVDTGVLKPENCQHLIRSSYVACPYHHMLFFALRAGSEFESTSLPSAENERRKAEWEKFEYLHNVYEFVG
jgi:hypothetical protein